MISTDALPHLLTIDELAEHLGVTVRHVRRQVAERRVPYLKVGQTSGPLRPRRDRQVARRQPPPAILWAATPRNLIRHFSGGWEMSSWQPPFMLAALGIRAVPGHSSDIF